MKILKKGLKRLVQNYLYVGLCQNCAQIIELNEVEYTQLYTRNGNHTCECINCGYLFNLRLKTNLTTVSMDLSRSAILLKKSNI